jgi:hypothetical protein
MLGNSGYRHKLRVCNNIYCLPAIKRLVVGLSTRGPRFEPCPAGHLGFVGEIVLLSQAFILRSSLVIPCQCHSTNIPYSSSPICRTYQKDKRASTRNLQTRQFRQTSDCPLTVFVIKRLQTCVLFPHYALLIIKPT